VRIATWNMKQAIAPKRPLPQLWAWAEQAIDPDVAVFTEARVPKEGTPEGWTAHWQAGGVGPRRTWGTVMAARGVELLPLTSVVVGHRTHELRPTWPGTTVVADVLRDGERWATLVGLYALTVDNDGVSCKHGGFSLRRLLQDIDPLFDSARGERVVVAGDFNLWPSDVATRIRPYDLCDLIELTAPARRAPLERCAACRGDTRCGHLWTHRNGNSPNAAVQQIDFILASKALAGEVRTVYGGVGAFPDAWDVSDHAPVVAEFD